MNKKEYKIILILVTFLIFSGFSLIFYSDGLNDINMVNSDSDNKIDNKNLYPKLSQPPEGRYIHREDPSEVTSYLDWWPAYNWEMPCILPPGYNLTVLEALENDDGRYI